MDLIFAILEVIGALALGYAVLALARRWQEQTEKVKRQHRQESDQRLRMVLESVPVTTLMLGRDGRIVFASLQAVQAFGYPQDELVGMDIRELVPTDADGREVDVDGWFGDMSLRDRMAHERRMRGRRKDGSEMPLLVRSRAATTPEGDFAMASMADMTEQLQLERESVQQREELAHLARVGTLAELSGSMAHELNQPLAAILSNAQAAQRFLAQDPPNLDEVRASVADIISDDKRAGETIRRLRSMLKKQAPDYQPVDLNLLLTEVLRLARGDLLNRQVRVSTELQPGLPAVRADLVQLHQVFINLVLNAGDAMAGEPEPHELVVSTHATSQGTVEVRFRDNGVGIPPPDLERIFEPFVTSKRDGIGLGLAVCRSLILDHGGRLWASNNLGRGATLHVALPKVDATPA